jgi:hypothetical protein
VQAMENFKRGSAEEPSAAGPSLALAA